MRLDNSIKKYGCVLSNYYIFKLEDAIFTQSDNLKFYKINNILIYIIIVLIFKLNKNQINNLASDKFINYIFFTKYGYKLFDNLYIRISNQDDIKPINQYKLLCYIIYYFSGLILKLNIWYTESVEYKKSALNINIHICVLFFFSMQLDISLCKVSNNT